MSHPHRLQPHLLQLNLCYKHRHQIPHQLNHRRQPQGKSEHAYQGICPVFMYIFTGAYIDTYI